MRNVWIGLAITLLLIVAGFIFIGGKGKYTQPAASIPQPSPSIQANSSTVTLTSSGFEPATLTIKSGDKVTWINKSGSDATVNSAPHPTHTDYPSLNLGNFSDGGMLFLTFDKQGTYKYHNHLNPSQVGTIVVQ